MNSKIYREQRAEILGKLKGFSDKLKEEKRSLFNEEERSLVNQLDKEQERLLQEAEDCEKVERIEGLTKSESRNLIQSTCTAPQRYCGAEERNKALAAWFYFGTKYEKREYTQAADREGINLHSNRLWLTYPEERAINVVSSATLGGDVTQVDNALMQNLDIARKAFGGMRRVASVFRSPTGTAAPLPTVDDTSNVGVLGAEADGSTQVADLEVTVGQKSLGSYRIDSKVVKISWELERDNVVNLTSVLLPRLLGERIGRRESVWHTTGTGSGQPHGCLTDATSSGITTAATAAFTYAEILQFFHSIDPAYRQSPNFAFVGSDDCLLKLRSVVDGSGRPILLSQLQGIEGAFGVGRSTMLFEAPFITNQQMPAATAGLKPLMAGDFSHFWIRDIAGQDGGVVLIRDPYTYSSYGMTSFSAHAWTDSMLVDSGTHPVKYITMHA